MNYKTIAKNGIVEEEIKKSRFICQVKRVTTEEEAREFIAQIKKEHYKATHNCSAFILGERSTIKRTSDDGEPSGTAGVPMLNVLEQHDLTDICVVVTRYFGGIKLGAGGLIRAYGGAVEVKELSGLAVHLSYSQYQEFNNFLQEHGLQEHDPQFTDTVTSTLYLEEENIPSIQESLIEFYKGKVSFSQVDSQVVELPLPTN